MYAEPGHLYHLFNQGNNQEVLFTEVDDYHKFLELTERHLLPACEILAWCLMPNHFHFCIQATEYSVKETVSGKFMIQMLSRAVGNLLSAYAALANHKQSKSGARFKPRTKLKILSENAGDGYAAEVIRYLHYYPVEEGLVAEPEDWPYSSALDYAGLREGKLCNLELARLLGLFST